MLPPFLAYSRAASSQPCSSANRSLRQKYSSQYWHWADVTELIAFLHLKHWFFLGCSDTKSSNNFSQSSSSSTYFFSTFFLFFFFFASTGGTLISSVSFFMIYFSSSEFPELWSPISSAIFWGVFSYFFSSFFLFFFLFFFFFYISAGISGSGSSVCSFFTRTLIWDLSSLVTCS